MTTIEDVHEVYGRNLNVDEHSFTDVMLATYFTTRMDGEPLWMIPVAPSGFGKTERARPLMKLSEATEMKQGISYNPYGIYLLDQVTARAFASGLKGTTDLGSRLQNNRSFLLMPDLASVIATEPEKRDELFAIFRTLYDGYIIRHTGIESKIYHNCHTNMFACSTPLIRENIEVLSQLGTREILYDIKRVRSSSYDKPVNENGRQEMFKVVKSFIDENKHMTFENPSERDKAAIITAADYISMWRAEATTDKNGLLTSQIECEYPHRLYKQLCQLWTGLKAMGLSSEQCKGVVQELNNGCGNRLRRDVYRSLYVDDGEFGERTSAKKNRKQIANELNRSQEAVTTQLMALRDLDLIEADGDIFTWETKWYAESKNLLFKL